MRSYEIIMAVQFISADDQCLDVFLVKERDSKWWERR